MHHVPRGGRDHRPTAMWLGAILASIAAGGALTPRTATAIAPDGHALYRQHCARCHGPQGGGTAEAPEPLAGDLSVNQLAAVIAETMPEDDPTLVAGDDALAVAAHIHATFYSAVARDRNRPARVDLARLTVRQHRAVLADVARRPILVSSKSAWSAMVRSATFRTPLNCTSFKQRRSDPTPPINSSSGSAPRTSRAVPSARQVRS